MTNIDKLFRCCIYHLSFVLTVRETCSASWLASHSSTAPDMFAVIGKVSVDTVMNRELGHTEMLELQIKVREVWSCSITNLGK